MRKVSILLLELLSTAAFGQIHYNIDIGVHVSPFINEIEQKLYVHYNNGNNCEIHDSVTIRPGKNNYRLHSWVPYEDDITLSFSKRGPARLRILACPKDHIELSIDKEDDVVGVRYKRLMKGKAHNNLYVEFWNKIDAYAKEKRMIEDSLALRGISQQALDILKTKYDSVKKSRIEYLKHIALTSHSPSVASDAQLFTWNDVSKKEWDSLLHAVYLRFPDYIPIQHRYFRKKWPSLTEEGKRNKVFIEKVIRSRIEIRDIKKSKSYGINQEINLNLLDSIGNVTPLSTYYGKYVLIEMWASWCLPCVKAMPNIIAAQNRFGGDFVCCAITIDKSGTSWKNSIKTHHLEGLHHYKATDNDGEMINEYKPLIASGTIPQNYLLDREGKIIAINIYGEELVKKLEELIKK